MSASPAGDERFSEHFSFSIKLKTRDLFDIAFYRHVDIVQRRLGWLLKSLIHIKQCLRLILDKIILDKPILDDLNKLILDEVILNKGTSLTNI